MKRAFSGGSDSSSSTIRRTVSVSAELSGVFWVLNPRTFQSDMGASARKVARGGRLGESPGRVLGRQVVSGRRTGRWRAASRRLSPLRPPTLPGLLRSLGGGSPTAGSGSGGGLAVAGLETGYHRPLESGDVKSAARRHRHRALALWLCGGARDLGSRSCRELAGGSRLSGGGASVRSAHHGGGRGRSGGGAQRGGGGAAQLGPDRRRRGGSVLHLVRLADPRPARRRG
jgi:hypothetical protein